MVEIKICKTVVVTVFCMGVKLGLFRKGQRGFQNEMFRRIVYLRDRNRRIETIT
jgi:hypothetical protein